MTMIAIIAIGTQERTRTSCASNSSTKASSSEKPFDDQGHPHRRRAGDVGTPMTCSGCASPADPDCASALIRCLPQTPHREPPAHKQPAHDMTHITTERTAVAKAEY